MGLKSYAANILRVLEHATPDEVRDGLAFYEEFRGVAVVLQRVYGLASVAHGAGVLAALSPMNDWHSNVTDAFHVARWRPGVEPVPVVRTTNPNRDKALAIRCGAHPERVLQGRKVRAFYLCTAAPEAGCAIAVDRHLAAIAAGHAMSDHETTRLLATEYRRIEATYMELAARSGVLGHQLASVAWFTWRRMKSTSSIGQLMLGEVAA